MNSILLSLVAATAAAIALMCVIFWIGRRMNNFGIVDIAWSWGFAFLLTIYLIMADGDPTRDLLLALPVIAWSGRLGWHLYRRVMGHHPVEDGRYRQLRAEWGNRVGSRMFWFYQLQAIVLVALSLPFLLVARNPEPRIAFVEWIGAALAMVALLGESLADAQLARFKGIPANHGKTCRAGLWRFSRHPNYFFEWLIWVGFFLIALGSPGGAVAVYCPMIMLYFLLRQTGIPATEEQALRTKGDDYRRYQKTTNAFVPWFPKKMP